MPRPARRASRPFSHKRLRLAILSLALLASLILFLQLTLLPTLLRGPLEHALGGSVRITRVSFSPAPAVIVHNPRVIAPGIPSDASRILRADAVRIELDGSDLLHGRLTPTRIVLEAPILRISQHAQTGAINLASLSPHAPAPAAASGTSARIPAIEIHGGAIELAEHSDQPHYEPFLTLPIEGVATPDPNNPARCAFTLRSRPRHAPPSAAAATIAGFFDASSLSAELALSDLTFDDFADLWTAERTSALWSQLDIAGRIPTATLSYAPETGPVATFVLERVGINLPVPEQTQGVSTPADLGSITADTSVATAPARLLRMNNVSGQISVVGESLRADLVGSIEDVRCRALLSTKALSFNAPFRLDLSTAEPFSLRQRAAILPFAPPIVRERLRTFSGPTAVVDAQVLITRGEPPAGVAAAPLAYSGLLTFRDGRAAFEDFPYPFSKLSGVVRFNDAEIRIEKITGVHPSGAKLLAEGRIAPPTDDAEVDLRITAVDVPLDAEFASCLPIYAQPLIDTVFDTEALDQLRALNLLPSGSGFALAGRADLDIHVIRPLGVDTEWTSDILLRTERAGVLVRAFPLPAIAEDVSLSIRDNRATLSAPVMRPLAGGTAALNASILFSSDPSQPPVQPTITIAAREVPLDGLLLHAVDASSGGAPGASSPTAILRRLNLEGLLDADASITPDQTAPEGVQYDIALEFRALASRPAAFAGAGACTLADIAGSARLTPLRFSVPRLEGRILAPDARDAGRFSVSLTSERARHTDTEREFLAEIIATNVELGAPLESVLAAVAPEEASRALDLRAARDPRGRVDASISLRSAPDKQGVAVSARLSAARELSFLTPVGRIAATSAKGGAVIDDAAVRFDGLGGTLALDSAPLGDITLHGALSIQPSEPSDLALSFSSQALPPATLHRLIDAFAEEPVELAGLRLGASFDLNASVTRATRSGSFSADVVVKPRSITVETADHSTIHFPAASGALTSRAGALAFDQLSVRSPELSVTVQGVVDPVSGPDLRFTASAPNLSAPLLALLPPNVRTALAGIELSISGPITVTEARLTGSLPSPDSPLVFTADAEFADASAEVGLTLSEAHGVLHLDAAPPLADIRVDVRTMSVSGLSLENATAVLHIDSTSHSVLVDQARADCHAGQIAAEVSIYPSAAGEPESPVRYDAGISLYGVAFGPALAEIRQRWNAPDAPDAPDAPGTAPTGTTTTEARAVSSANAAGDRGLLDAQLSLSGSLADPSSRVGRGSIRVSQGRIVSLPLLNRLIELSNLSLPFNSPLDSAYARFFLRGRRVTFERLSLSSDAVTLVGQGNLTYPDMNLDLRFTSRGNLRIPLISDLLEAIRNEIITTTVTGPLASPDVSPAAFTGTRDLLDDLFSEPSPPEAPTLRPDR